MVDTGNLYAGKIGEVGIISLPVDRDQIVVFVRSIYIRGLHIDMKFLDHQLGGELIYLAAVYALCIYVIKTEKMLQTESRGDRVRIRVIMGLYDYFVPLKDIDKGSELMLRFFHSVIRAPWPGMS